MTAVRPDNGASDSAQTGEDGVADERAAAGAQERLHAAAGVPFLLVGGAVMVRAVSVMVAGVSVMVVVVVVAVWAVRGRLLVWVGR